MVLRYFIGFNDAEERFKMLVDFLGRSGISRVILFSETFTENSAILPEEYYKNHVELLRPYVKKLKDMGVETGINMTHTNGHCFYADEEEFGFRRAITLEGEGSRGSVCMLDKAFLEHIKRAYKYYASLEPSVIFADDDIRMISLGQFICLCPDHIKAISDRVGKTLDASEIRGAVLGDSFGNAPIREAFFEQLKDDIEFTISQIADSVHEVSPKTEIGIMTTSYPAVTADRDLSSFFKKLKNSKKVTRIRTGMDFYREGDHNSIPLAFSNPMIQRDFINDISVEIQPEIENDTYGFYYKSNSITAMQLLWCLTNGFRNMQLNIFNWEMPVFNYEEITNMFSESIDYHNKITELIPEGHRTSGIGIYAHPRAMTRRRPKDGKLFFTASWYKWFGLLGMPVSSEPNRSDFIMLTGDDILLSSDSEIDSLLKKGAVIDLRASECLLQRGYGKRIGISSINKIGKVFSGEHFTDDPLNGEFKGVANSDYFYSSLIEEETAKEITYHEGARLLSFYVNHRGERVCGGIAAYENEKGERFVILPYVDTGFTYFTNVNHKRRRQLISSFEWIARKKLPICAENEKMCANINSFPCRNVITMFNLASDDVKAPKLRYTSIGSLKYINRSGELLHLEAKSENGTLILDREIRALGVLIIVDEVQ